MEVIYFPLFPQGLRSAVVSADNSQQVREWYDDYANGLLPLYVAVNLSVSSGARFV